MKFIFGILSKFIVFTILIVLLTFLAGYGMSWLKMEKVLNLWYVEINTIKQISFHFNYIYTIIISASIAVFLQLVQYMFKSEK